MGWSVVAAIVTMSLTSIPFVVVLNKMNAMRDERIVFIGGIISLALATILPALYIRRFYRNIDPLIYGIICFLWTAVLGLFIGLEVDGYVSGYMAFYIDEGEPYMKTAYATVICYWDATGQMMMYLAIITFFCIGKSYREVGLYWVGSIMNSILVFLPGNVIGPFGIKWSFLLNVPYVLLPLWAGFKFFRERPLYLKSYLRIPSITERPVDCAFIGFFFVASAVAVFRGMAVLGAKSDLMYSYLSNVEPYLNDPNAYPKMQILVYLYYYLFYYLTAIYGLLCPTQPWMADWALIHGGAAMQSQYVHILGTFHHRTPASMHAPVLGLSGLLFWVINLALMIVPQLFTWRCLSRPDLFGETYTVNLSEPITEDEEGKKEKLT